MIRSLLIANRGEIACRVIRTARRLGVRTVAVYSDADAHALHVRQADEAVHIGPSPARESYLVGERIIAAAQQTGAEAIHPGYGFLSENADFAQSVLDAGLIWIGPRPHAIRAMGLKDAAKKLMAEAGVPVTPGYLGEDQSPATLQAQADAIGYPVLIKAVAGGGGKGMRRVESAAEFQDSLQSCKREAASSFGDDRVLLEKYILSPRHIEVQVFGDAHGNVVHLFERDCSLQRRHQKVIEEAPAPGMDPATREAVCASAVRAAKAVDYQGAGTIEFIADASEGLRADRIWFMEMNTRLQVEHPVTEEITGQDLVEWQLRVASGEPLPKRQEELRIRGWAVEARLYAEDPANGFLPSPGRVDVLKHFAGRIGPDYHHTLPRFDMGVEAGDEVTSFYDPMVGKVIARARDRHTACEILHHGLSDLLVWPLKTNAGLLTKLVRAMRDEELVGTTSMLDRELDRFLPAEQLSEGALLSVLNELIAPEFNEDEHGGSGPLAGFRLNADRQSHAILYVNGTAIRGRYRFHGDADLDSADDGWGKPYLDGSDGGFVVEDGKAYAVSIRYTPGQGAGSAADGAILSPMPGRIIAVDVAAGERVAKGAKLVTLEAMKMEHSLVAPFDGVVAELSAEAGGQVSEGALLARVEREG